MNKYLILAETEEIGYFIEVHSEIDAALDRAQLYFELAFNPPYDYERLHVEFKPIGSYQINDQNEFPFESLGGHSNGFCSTHVMEIDDNFDGKKFAVIRSK